MDTFKVIIPIKLACYTIIILLFSCTGKPQQIQTELYFGLSNQDGPIAPVEWNRFRENTLEKTFNGYTILKANGYWKGDNGKSYDEETALFIYIHPDSPNEEKKLDSVIKVYKQQFNQESVLKVSRSVNVSF